MRKEHDERWDAAQEGAELLREGELDKAIHELERQASLDPQNEYVAYFLASAHFEKGDYNHALKGYLRALEVEPSYAAALGGVGHALRMMGHYADAIRVGHQILAKNQHDPEALYLIGLCHYAQGNDAAAVRYLERFLDTKPEYEVALEVEGLVQILRGPPKELDTEEGFDPTLN